MSTRTGPGHTRPAPQSGGSASAALISLADVTAAVQRANHITSFACWTVTTIAMGLVLEIGGLLAPGPPVWLLAVLLPVLAAVVRAVLLLVRAAAAGSAVGGVPGWSAGAAGGAPPTAEQVWDRLHLAAAAVQHREVLAGRALTWAYTSGIGFGAWSLLATLLSRGRWPGG